MAQRTSKLAVQVPLAVVAILHRNQLDCDALGCLIATCDGFHVAGTATSIAGLDELCARTAPDFAVLDASFPPGANDVFFEAQILKCRRRIRRLLFVDERPNRARAELAIAIAGAGYVTRQRSGEQFLAAFDQLAEGPPPLDGFVVDWMRTDRHLKMRLHSSNPLSRLTARELEVFQLLAQGQSVAGCAEILQLSQETVQNHRLRLMDKLGVQRQVELIRVAIREQLIAP